MSLKFFLVFLFILFLGIISIIISSHLFNQRGRSSQDSSKIDTDLPYTLSNSKTMISMTPNRSSQYIWCVNHYGPNNQLRDFVKCCIIALMHNYTLIIPPLFPHSEDKIQGTQWFDHFYDLKKLSLAINLVTLDQFISENINKKKVMIDCYIKQFESVIHRAEHAWQALVSVENAFKINITFHRHINVSRYLYINELSNKSKTCSSIFLHIHYMTFVDFFYSPNLYTRLIFKHLYRTPLIQRMASALIKLLPQLVINRNHSQNQFHTLAVMHMRLGGDRTVMSISMYIEKILYLIKIGVRFTHLHIMCPYLNASDIKYLTKRLPMPFTTTQHLLFHVHFTLDEYLFDVLEQEIAYQAPIFLASRFTTYSATVIMQKVCQDKGTVYISSSLEKTQPFLVTKENLKYYI